MVEQKHHKLARSLRSGPINRELKPNAATRDQLNVSHMMLGPVILVISFSRILKIVRGPPELVLLDLIYNIYIQTSIPFFVTNQAILFIVFLTSPY